MPLNKNCKAYNGEESEFLKVKGCLTNPFPLPLHVLPTKSIFLDFLVAPEASLVLLALLLCFLPPLFLLATPLSLLWLSQRKKTQEAHSLFHTHGPTPKERKTLNSSLPLTPTGLAARNKSFFQIFSSSCYQLEAKLIPALSFQESVSRVKGKSNPF